VALHHQALADLIHILSGKGVADPQRIFLLGFSQSCALNYRFVFAHPDHLCGVIGICGGIPGDWEASETYKATETIVFHLAGRRDEFYPPERVSDYADRLRLRARDVVFESYDAGHEIVPAMRHDVRAWLERKANG
jgi:phospholipase/carboxylesterase